MRCLMLTAVLCYPSGGRSVTTAVTVGERLGVGPAGGADKQEGRREADEKKPPHRKSGCFS